MNRILHFLLRVGARMPLFRRSQCAFLGFLALLLAQLLFAAGPALAQSVGADFDHDTTGYPLVGLHQTVRCESCHINGVFQGTRTDCVACHGITAPRSNVTISSSHLPVTGIACESCHSPASQFGSAVFTHVYVLPNSCSSCHGGAYPQILSAPQDATHNVAASSHTSCDICHNLGSFSNLQLLPNHIPVQPGGSCLNCHSTDFSAMPSVTNIHANAPSGGSNCAQCHSAANAAMYAMPTLVPAIKAPPANHVPTGSAGCEVCHVGVGSSLQLPVQNGASFANSLFSHSGISSGCASCHGPGASGAGYYGVSSIVTMPTSSSPGPVSHIPSNTNCEACHLGSLTGLGQIAPHISGNPTLFQLPAPSSAQIHAGVSGSCASCHEANSTWIGMAAYARTGTPSYSGFYTRPQATPDAYGMAPIDAAHPASGDCSQCHAGISFNVNAVKMPGNHIPVAASAQCTNCHDANNFATMPSLTLIHANAPANAANCAQCHSAANAAAYAMPSMVPPLKGPTPDHMAMGNLGCDSCHVAAGSGVSLPVQTGATFTRAGFMHTGISTGCASCHGAIDGSTGVGTAVSFSGTTQMIPKSAASLAPNHIPTALPCETCHTSVPAALIPWASTAVSFAGANFTHSGISNNCVNCHGPNVNSNTFYGLPGLIAMPASGTPGPGAHLPTSTTCESCHLAPTGFTTSIGVLGSSGFKTPTPSNTQIHAGISSGCAACHEYNYQWIGVTTSPSPYPAATAAPYSGFQTRPTAAGGAFSVVDAAHPVNGDCANCHGISTSFTTPVKSSNHIPTAANASCAACHIAVGGSIDYSQMPPSSYGLIHANAPSSSSNCAQCHSAANAALYSNAVMSIKTASADHIAMGNLGCEACHVASIPVQAGSTFANASFSHSGISSGCASCHASGSSFFGVVPKSDNLTPAHVPEQGAACETCHVNSVPSMLIPATGASGSMTTFSGAKFSHSGLSAGCETCHASTVGSGTFYGINSIVVMPPSATPGAASHIPVSTGCASCHAGSVPAALVPGNATHLAPGSLFASPVPTASMIHTGVSTGCAGCHEYNNQWMGVTTTPTPYAATTAAPFRGFQVRPTAAGGSFSFVDALHPQAGDCSNCHGSFVDFSSPSKSANHIPTAANASCAACHIAVGGTIDYSQMPPSSYAAIHANAPSSTSNCAQCHSAANAALYSNAVMTIRSVPSNHIDMGSAGCEACHVASVPVQVGSTFAYSSFSHSGITASCASCHASGSAFYGVTPKSDSLTPPHVPEQAGAACDSCHLNSVPTMPIPATGATGTMTTFAGAKFSHSGLSSGCETCHASSIASGSFYGINSIVVMPPSSAQGSTSHIPTSASCASCHAGSVPTTLVPGNAAHQAPGSLFATPVPTAAMIHAGVSSGCAACHEYNYQWMGVTSTPSPYAATGAAPFRGFQTRPTSAGGTFSFVDAGHPLAGDCSNCHGSLVDFTAPSKPANHIPTAATAACTACHVNTNYAAMPTLTAIHANAPSSSSNCAQCHSASNAASYSNAVMVIKPVPGNHIDMGSLGCEACHVGSNSSLMLPVQNGATFANSAFSHQGLSKLCADCHGSSVTAGTFFGVTPKTIASLAPAHVPTTLACNVCHANVPAGLVPPSGGGSIANFGNASFIHTGISSGCNTCHDPSITSSSFYGLPNIVVMPPTAPVGASAHLPTSTTCETCHAVPSGFTTTAGPLGSSGFKSPAPTAAMIHTGISSNCAACHDTNNSWLSVAVYPITSAAPYRGFQTRPQASAGQFFVADAAHPASGDCANCHGSFVDFTAPSKPANHIPTSVSAACASCHIAVAGAIDYSQMPVSSYGNIHANAPSSSSNCAQCHSAANAALYSNAVMAIKTVPANHVDLGGLGCEACHVASIPVQSGSSFANASFSHSGITTNCGNCHSSGSTFYGVTPKSDNLTPMHVPVMTPLGCETCHVNSIPAMLIPASGASAGMTTFAGAKFSHGTLSWGCETCHANSITASSFYGISSIVTMPASALPGSTSHIPSTATCVSCHAGSVPSALLAANAAHLAPGTGFATPVPTSSMVHTGVTSGCASCHEFNNQWVGVTTSPSPYPAAMTAPYTGFQTRPTAATGQAFSVSDAAHPGSGDCSNCHGGFTDFTAPSKPANHIPTATTATCSACHANPNYAIMPQSQYAAIHANAPSASSNCAQCHSAANAATYAIPAISFSIKAPASNHIAMGNLGCESCHSASIPVQNTSVFAGGLFSHSGISSGCASCHVSGLTFQGVSNIVVMPQTSTPGATAHPPTTSVCESCHLGSTPTTLLGVASTPALGSTAFATPAPDTNMIHNNLAAGAVCSTCHEAGRLWVSMGKYPITSSSPYTGFQTRPISGGSTYSVNDALHPSSGECSVCHSGFSDFAATAKPANHIPYAATASCTSCHTAGSNGLDYSVMPQSSWSAIHANAPSSSTNCGQCHSAANAANYAIPAANFTIKAPGSDHMPMGALGCENCHTGSLPVTSTSSFKNAGFSHTGFTTCAPCHSTVGGNALQFSASGLTPLTPKSTAGLAPVHVPSTQDCVLCHTNVPSAVIAYGSSTYSFAGGQFSHAGISSGCVSCHGSGVTGTSFQGISSIVVLSNYSATAGASAHIPVSGYSDCEICHTANTPATLVAANASSTVFGSTQFKSPAPTGAVIHSKINVPCQSCHEAGMQWIDVTLYTRSPTTFVSGGTYIGYQTRPTAAGAAYSVVDSNHPTSGDCANCHGSTVDFNITSKPSNHIPTATTAACTACHTQIGTSSDFSVLPTLPNIHAYAPTPTGNCAQCHSAANAPTFNMTVNGVPYAVKAPSSNHVPLAGSTACETCHVGTGSSLASTAVPVGASFNGSLYAHTGITTACASCHGTGIGNSSFANIPAIVALTTSATTNGASSHIPTAAACEACHLGNVPAGQMTLPTTVSISGGATQFKLALTSASNTALHAGITAGCATCHEKNYLWLGMQQTGYYASSTVAGGASYTGFLTRPYGVTGNNYTVNDANHASGTLASGDCSQCHGSTTSFSSAAQPAGHMPTSTSTCSTCHLTAGDYGTTTLAAPAALHPGISAVVTKLTAIPALSSTSCVTCHTVGSGGTSGKAPFSGCTTVQASCASPPPLSSYQPMVTAGKVGGVGLGTASVTHVPIGTLDCTGCHASVSAFSGTTMGTNGHSNATLGGDKCLSCHEAGLSFSPTTSTITKRPSNHTGSKAAPNDCSGCHKYSSGGFRLLVKPSLRAASVNPDINRLRPGSQWNLPSRGALGNAFNHQGVEVGRCKTCHDGRKASGMPARHLMVSQSCDTCHRTSAWLPAQFTHAGVSPNTCMACHNGLSATARPAGHFMTARSCDACHKTAFWSPVSYSHLSPAYQSAPGLATCISCHITNSEIIPRQLRALNRVKPS